MTSSHVGILHPWNMSVTTSVQQSLQMSVVRIQTVPRFVRVDDSYRTQDRQSLLKAKSVSYTHLTLPTILRV